MDLLALKDTPVPSILIIAGIVFLLLALGGQIAVQAPLPLSGRRSSGVLGLILLLMGIGLYLQPKPNIPTPVGVPTQPPAPSLTATPMPRMFNFSVCLQPCDGTNSTRVLPERTTRIYFQYNYENIPTGANYVRIWAVDGKEWIRYTCTWPGPSTKQENLSLFETGGMRSGVWQITIYVNGQVLLREGVQVQGNWLYFSPNLPVNSCYGN